MSDKKDKKEKELKEREHKEKDQKNPAEAEPPDVREKNRTHTKLFCIRRRCSLKKRA